MLNFEKEKYASTTGEIVYWIKTDISSTTDKTIYMYYGNASASDQATTTGVWDDNYVMVNHLAHDGVATTTYPDFNDSTKYDNDGSSKNMNSDDLVDGQIDGSLDFDGEDNYVNTGLNPVESTNGLTFSVWFKTSGTANSAFLAAVQDSGYQITGLTSDTQDHLVFYVKGSAKIGNTSIEDGNWHYAVGRYDEVNIKLYIDGIQETGATDKTGDVSADANLVLGKYSLLSYFFTGIIDEVRISNIARHSSWISTEYNNQSDVSSFMTFGAEVCVPKPVERSGGENVKIRIKGGTRIKGGVRF